jgi:2-oxo-4-hydroxy-4-carboxy-5-ureidoimidazoline decarboxylase
MLATGVFEMADVAMDTLTDEEWLEAMSAHPRIGQRGGDAPASSEREQSRAMGSSPETLAALAAENRRYEERFGHVFLIFASGRSGEEILAELRRRMTNDPATELEEAKLELRKIAKLRLERMLAS